MGDLRTELFEEILPFVDKPLRYTGGEINSTVKDWNGRTSVALIYPDTYEVGAPNIGLRILYHLLNQKDEYVCERAYSPWTDMDAALRAKGMPLFSLETHTPLNCFDILGFSFQYELLYTNFLNILDLCGIKFRSRERTDGDPYIFAGGPASVNLEPVADFLDAVCIGDGETRIVEMSRVVREGKLAGKPREAILRDLAEIPGVYVPMFYDVRKSDGFLIADGPRVRRYIEPDLNKIDFPVCQIVPYLKTVQDRAVVEIMRGCGRGCRFCQAGFFYRPVRERDLSNIVNIAKESILCTGHNEFSLISLSVSDYSNIAKLLPALEKQFTPKGISFSLPSMRIDSFNVDLARSVKTIRSSGLTFAVEGGTQALRDRINKNVTEEELVRVTAIARELGWRSVKLYFMIGLPGWKEIDEIQGIAALIQRLMSEVPKTAITVSVAVFVPKPHTPFQWEEQMPADRAKEEFHRLIGMFRRNGRVNIRYNNPYVSRIEGVFSRGDRALSGAVEAAFGKGARFDGWSEFFSHDLWTEVFHGMGIDEDVYLRQREPGSEVPWAPVDSGIDDSYQMNELKLSADGGTTPDCRDKCGVCGTCDFETVKTDDAEIQDDAVFDESFLSNIDVFRTENAGCIRFLYRKQGILRFMSQIDLEQTLCRAFVRANIPVKFTEGFNKHIRLEMGWALPIGFGSEYEVSQIEVNQAIDPDEFTARMNSVLPDDLRISASKHVEKQNRINRAAHEQMIEFRFRIPSSRAEVSGLYEKNREFKKVTPKGEKIIDLKDFILSLNFEEDEAVAVYRQADGGARIQDIIEALTGMDTRQAVRLNPQVDYRYVVREGNRVGVFDV
ncbi:MAG: hypothetical protein A2Y33_14750 [Spirochaetes bacterium GWF1_51_8]|nr:MAG: hypothetical protein A2Y33_14750 [Spirochaetes bacterium GWF1_51_8]